MKKSRLMLSTFCLALAITFVSASSVKVFASDDPQGESRSTQTTPQPPPPSTIMAILAALASMF